VRPIAVSVVQTISESSQNAPDRDSGVIWLLISRQPLSHDLPTGVVVRDVGPRDGLQGEAPVDVAQRVRMIEGLIEAGLNSIEICSFVSPKAVPSMAGAAEVVNAIGRRPNLTRTALVPNRRGAELAIDAGLDEITVTVSASAAYNERNVKMTIDESLAAVIDIVGVCGDTPVDAVISCAFGSPYEGEIEPADVASICTRVLDSGVARVTLADTTGMATPRRIDDVLGALTAHARHDVGLHLHETRGTALVNAFAAMQRGVRRFDTSVGGLGGSPFAAGAAGNLATEDLVHLCDDLMIATGIDLTRLLSVSEMVAEIVGHTVPSRVSAAGPRLARS
jgi:hydroxymethylglutaryl-CoA lyase